MSGGTAPDLRKSKMSMSYERLREVLHEGSLIPAGMPDYKEFTPEEVEGLRHYFRREARKALAAQ